MPFSTAEDFQRKYAPKQTTFPTSDSSHAEVSSRGCFWGLVFFILEEHRVNSCSDLSSGALKTAKLVQII